MLKYLCVLFVSAVHVSAWGLDVTRFGAVPDDGGDDTAAFLAVFKQAQDAGEKKIVIPKGRYHLRTDGNPERPGALLAITGADGLSVEGDRAELITSGSSSLFFFIQCEDVRVRGLTIDQDRPPFSEGTVIASADRHFDVKVLDAYPVRGGEPVTAFMTYNPKTRLPDGRDLDVYRSVARTERIAPQVLRVHLMRPIPVPVGKLLVLRHSVYEGGAFRFYRCRDVRVEDVTVHATSGMGLVGHVCEDVTLKRFDVRMRPGSDRLMSATADATHFGGCKGAVVLEDCTFEGMGDDGANIKSGLYLIVRERVDDRTVLGQHNLRMVDLPDAGDVMEFSRVDTLVPFASGKVRAAKLEPGEGNVHRVEFESPLPDELRVGDVLGNVSRGPKLRMRRCTVRANRARGVLCQTRDVVIEDCTFEHCTSGGVLVLTEVTHFFESIGTRDVVVRNCRFTDCNRGAASAEGVLCAMAWLKDFAHPPGPGVHRNVTFANNRIVGTPESAIFAAGVDGLKIVGNVIEQACERADRPNGCNAIFVKNSARVEIEDNEIDPARQGKGMTEPIRTVDVE